MKDTDACSIVFYTFNAASEDAETKKYVLPDLSDISSIGYDPDEDSPDIDLPLQWPHSPPEDRGAPPDAPAPAVQPG
eukprot:3500944-Pyramimonas_sp.AAC.1